MSETTDLDIRVDRVVCAVADDDLGRIPLQHAVLRGLRDRHTEVHVVRVLDEAASDENIDGERDRLREFAAGVVEELSNPADKTTPALWLHVVSGDPAEEITGLCEQLGADHLILGPGRTPGAELASAIVQNAPCSVEVVHPKEYDAEREDERRRRCPACAKVRESTHGRTWFCKEHHSESKFHLFPLVASHSLRPTQFG